MTGQGRFVALFRAINVGGTGKVAMADLRDMAVALGFDDPRTVLQTGNLVFGAQDETQVLEMRIEAASAEGLGLTSDVMARDQRAWADLVAANPFPAAARDDPAQLVLLVLKSDAASAAQSALDAAIKGRELVRVTGRAAYVVFPDGIGRSKLTPQLLERHLGTRATGRNWNTVEKIAALLPL